MPPPPKRHPQAKGGSKTMNKKHSKKEVRSVKKKIGEMSKKRFTSGKSVPARGGRQVETAVVKSHRTSNIDIHLAAKVASDLKAEINQFKERQAKVALFDEKLNALFAFVTPSFLTQHTPSDIMSFRSYLSRFQVKNSNNVTSFMNWVEWSYYELNKGKNGGGRQPEPEMVANEGSDKKSKMQVSLAQKVAERSHVTALLSMCVRHNAGKRRQGLHAFVNYINKTIDENVDVNSVEAFKTTAHHTVVYAVTRVILGMAVEDASHIVMLCDALFHLLCKSPLTASVVLSLIDEELALSSRMKAVKGRLNVKSGSITNEELDEMVDTEDINDPTRGERNQRLNAALFALGAVICSPKELNLEDAVKASCFLSFCYVEQKATRVLSANLLFRLWQRYPQVLHAEEAVEWCTFAFFYYPKLEYFRPEALQCLLRLMEMPTTPKQLPPSIVEYVSLDPLKPSVMEQLANALFRNEQVTQVHPMLHPVWKDLFDLMLKRCGAGESLQEHLTTFVHTVIVPYRRGSSDVPRRTLFQNLVMELGQIAVQSADHRERTQVLEMANKAAGYGKKISAKASTLAELKQLPVSALQEKVMDLISQYKSLKDSDLASHSNRKWILRELRNSLLVPVREGISCDYVNDAAFFFLRYGFFPPKSAGDQKMANHCIYLFAELFSFTLKGDLMRPKSTVNPREIMTLYLEKEEKGLTRYKTAVDHKKFKKARNLIVDALENSAKRSVLFYDKEDIEILLVLLFLMLSVDDASNADATLIATSVVPDLTHFFLNGSLDSLDMLYDIMMTIILRKTSPLHVLPLQSCIRRIAIGYMQKFAKFIRSEETVTILLAPLKEAFNTDSRELARLARVKNGENEDSDSEEDDQDQRADPDEVADDESQGDSESSSDNDDDEDDESTSAGSEQSAEGGDSEDTDTEEDEEQVEAEAPEEEAEADTKEDEVVEEEEPPTAEYINALKGMVGNVDLDHSYPVDTENKEKSDTMRIINVVARVGVQMTSPHVLHIFQVLLAVCREEVKSADDVIFNGCLSSIDLLLVSKNRYFGTFLPALKILQLLGDIQSYCRKSLYYLFKGSAATPKQRTVARQRLARLKAVSLRVFHYVALLAFKNEAGDDVHIALTEYYKSIFCDRGWEMKRLLAGIKKDLYYYRQGFAWVMLPAAFSKFHDVAGLDSRLRFRVFEGCCVFLEGMLPRLSGLPVSLKVSCRKAICDFVHGISVKEVYDIKHTLPFTYLHAMKHIVLYNKRVELDPEWIASDIIDACVDDDSLQLSSASIRLLSDMEKLLGRVPKARETKVPTPVKVLHSQFNEKTDQRSKKRSRAASKSRSKVLKSLLAYRNDDATDEERAKKRRRREELKVEDRLQRQTIREHNKTVLSKEEREEKRKKILMAKQQRIAKNKERKRRVFHMRQKSFEEWRESKLASSDKVVPRPIKTQKEKR